jgi:hypothetical protein
MRTDGRRTFAMLPFALLVRLLFGFAPPAQARLPGSRVRASKTGVRHDQGWCRYLSRCRTGTSSEVAKGGDYEPHSVRGPSA